MNKQAHESAPRGEEVSARLRVRLGAIVANYREVRARAGAAAVAPVVKADAYGLGMEPVARALAGAGADSFFVARVEEGVHLRALLPAARIYVLDGLARGTAPALAAHRLTPVLNSLEEIAEWSERAKREKRTLDAALQIDTGMNRSGLAYWELPQLASRARAHLSRIAFTLAMSHLACADEPDHALNRMQLERFRAALAQLPPAPASIAASAGIELGSDYLFDVVRPGLALYGGNPVPHRVNPYATAAVLTGRVLQVRRVAKGEGVGYGAVFVATRPSVVAIVALGYADGLIRACGRTGFAAIGGHRIAFSGRISMDLAALDATDVPAELVTPGAEVEFFGDTVTLEEVAEAAGTIAHEVLTSVAPRARRVYSED